MRLLIVDDDLPFRERLTRSMEKKGFDVTSSPGVKDSLDKVSEKVFDYAVVDMRLEDGSGLELIKELADYENELKEVKITLEDLEIDGFGAHPYYWFLVAEHKGQIIGLSFYWIRYSTWKGKLLYFTQK